MMRYTSWQLALLGALSVVLLAAPWASADVVVRSPGGKVVVTVRTDGSGVLTYGVELGGTAVVSPSRLGIVVDGTDLGQQAKLGEPAFTEINETYPLLGVHATAVNHGTQATIPVRGGTGATPWVLEVRAYDDGAAYRYRVPGQGPRKVGGEASEWVLPAAAKIWFQNDLGAYEGLYTATTVGQIKPGTIVAFPATLELPEHAGYVTVTEADLVNYSDLALTADDNHALKALFHADKSGWTASGEIVSPWRVTIVAPDLDALVNSDLVHNLCPPPSAELAHADWILPGRCTWQWWSSGAPKLAEQHQFVDWTRQLGFEYYLIDEGWAKWKAADGKDQWGLLKEVVDYATTQQVRVFIWVHSKEVFKPDDRRKYFARAKACGVVGVKIDFPPPGSVGVINWYEQTLRDAAAEHLLVDFHGAVKPTGRDRTWPNEITREAIRGHEYHITRYHRVQPPEHDTILPFTRYIAGHGDYTPTAFNPKELVGYTWPRELAQAIVFTSPLLCYADRPSFYLENPAVDVLKSIPATWDQTIVLPGSEIGKVAAFARRNGDAWFIGVINGGEATRLDLPLSFLGAGPYELVKVADVPGKDDALDLSRTTARAGDRLPLAVRAKGGFVARLTPVGSAAAGGA